MSIMTKVRHYIPYDGDLRSRAERWSRAARRLTTRKRLRQARYPWNAAAHQFRWATRSRQDIEKWLSERLQLEAGFWLFIAGCNNSGTTLLHKILGSHPEIRALPREGMGLTTALPTPSALGVPRLFTKRLETFRWTEDSDPSPALRTKYDWARYVDARPGAILAKSPEDAVRTRWLQKNFSPARFIAIARSPYAVCEGTRRRSGHSIEEAARHWAMTNQCLLEDLPFLRQCLLVRYEDFCAAPAEHLAQFQEFLSLETPFGDEALQARAVHNIDKKTSGVQNFNARSIERLSPQDIAAINLIAGPLMERLEYDQL